MKESHTTYAAVGAGGSLAVLLPWILKVTTGVLMPPDVAVAADTLISVIVGFFLHKTGVET